MFETKRGRILRVKLGYNPNSSSIGSIVYAIPTMLFVSSIIFGVATTVIFSRFSKKIANKTNNNDDAQANE